MSTDINTIKGVFIFDLSKKTIYGSFTDAIYDAVRDLNEFKNCVMNRILSSSVTEDQGFFFN